MTSHGPTGNNQEGSRSTAITSGDGDATEMAASAGTATELTALGTPRSNSKRSALRGLLLGVTPLAGIALVTYLYATGGRFVTTENAYVKAEIITISANIDGQVTHVLAKDNQPVEKGDPLFTIDARPHEMEITNKISSKIRELGMFTFVRWNYIFIAPPLSITREQVDEGLEIISQAIAIADECYTS